MRLRSCTEPSVRVFEYGEQINLLFKVLSPATEPAAQWRNFVVPCAAISSVAQSFPTTFFYILHRRPSRNANLTK